MAGTVINQNIKMAFETERRGFGIINRVELQDWEYEWLEKKEADIKQIYRAPAVAQEEINRQQYLLSQTSKFKDYLAWTQAHMYGDDPPAANCTHEAVQAAITAASSGQTVTVPSGDCTWDLAVTITGKALTLQGAGLDITNITDGVSGDYNPMMNIAVTDTNFVTLRDFTFIDSTAAKQGTINITNSNFQVGFRVTNVRVNQANGTGSTFFFKTSAYGLFDNCHFDNTSSGGGSKSIATYPVGPDGHGFDDWKRSQSLGSNEAVYIEDCVFDYDTIHDGAIDSYGSNYVFRYNTVYNTWIEHHGTDSGSERSPKLFEIYNNTFYNNISPTGSSLSTTYNHFRGGTGVVYNNTFTGTYAWAGLGMDAYRGCLGDRGYWGYANWGHQWLHCSQEGYGMISCVSDHNGDESTPVCYLWGSQHGTCSKKWCSTTSDTDCTTNDDCPGGETCSRYLDGGGTGDYPLRDQIGRTTNQALLPLYFWNNGSINIAAINRNSCGENVSTNLIIENRDYCIGTTTMPTSCGGVANTYIAYDYPHLLQFTPSASESPSISPSTSPSLSLSASLSPSKSPSESPSASPSTSPSSGSEYPKFILASSPYMSSVVTTRQMTVPSGKSTFTHFSAGLMTDDENPISPISTTTELGIEFVTNGDMESDLNPPKYDWEDVNSPDTNERSSSSVHGGTYSRHIVDSDPGSYAGVRNTYFTSTSGRTYRISFWYNLVSGYMRLVWLRGSDGSGQNVTSFGGAPTGWVYYEGDYTETTGGSSASVVFINNRAWPGSGNPDDYTAEFYIDDVSVKEAYYKFTEIEWNVQATSETADGETYEFRVTRRT